MTRFILPHVAAGLLAVTGPCAALTPEFPGPASETGTRTEAMGSYRLPVGPFDGTAVPTLLTEGALDQRAWRIALPGVTTLQLLMPLRDQVTAAGYEVIYECEAVACGGFDFRFGTDVLPEPDMHVDLGDYRYLAARRDTGAGPEYLSLIVSRAADQGFVQMTRVGRVPPATGEVTAAPLPASPPAADPLPTRRDAPGALADRLVSGGAQVLPDLVFASGSAVLLDGEYPVLNDLAAFLRANPKARVILVGHTDAAGALEANIALSRQRAQSVRQRLLVEFDIPPDQVQADGVGYLAPRAPNDTEAGRLENRRVEVMLLSMGAE